MTNRIKLVYSFLIISILLFTGCSTNKDLYYWGSYEPQVYSYFKGESVEEQIIALEKDLSYMNSTDKLPPPGFYAHLGMLYSKAGRSDETKAMFDLEQSLYPESSVFINNLNNKFIEVKP